MYQRILVPYDGSVTSDAGLDEAIKLAGLTGASLRVLHLIDVLSVATGFETATAYLGEILPLMREAGAKLLQDARARAEAAGVKADSLLVDRVGARLSDEVSAQATEWKADLIVIGTHGRRGVRRLFLGSDAEQIVRTAAVPVLLVKAALAEADGTAKVSLVAVSEVGNAVPAELMAH